MFDHDSNQSAICRRCRQCCRDYPFVELSGAEVAVLEQASGLDPDVFAHRKRADADGYFLKFKDNGDCYFLSDDEDDAGCSVYAARASVCRAYPSKPGQDERCAELQAQVLGEKPGG